MSTSDDNVFEEVLTNAGAVEEKYMGPSYPYYKYIKAPSEIGMTGKGSLSALGKDINGLVSYVELLVSGKSKASATGQPLGNKFFLKTGGKCNDVVSNEKKDRHIYIDNVPAGNVPLISSGAGVNFSEFRGLIPGTISNLNAFNPYTIMQGFLMGSTPDCQELTMETIDTHNNKSTETNFVTLVDIQNMDPCIFPDKINPITETKCRETFTTINGSSGANGSSSHAKDILLISICVAGIYVMYKSLKPLK
jgi:hypothetical protein